MSERTEADRASGEQRVLVLLAHPALHRSRVHRLLLRAAHRVADITIHDLYDAYPDFDIDVTREQSLLRTHDVIVCQHPFYWYSTPPLMKQWEDLVLEHGWAYGREGKALHGKAWMHAISAGGSALAYRPDGHNRFTISQLLAPLEQTVRLCGMRWVEPFVVHGTHLLTDDQITTYADDYAKRLAALRDGRVEDA